VRRGDLHETFRFFGIALAQYARGRLEESDAALRELIEKHADATYQIGEAYAFRGEVDAAFEWLERDRANAFGEMMWDPLLRNLHSDPRWEPFLRTMGSAD
jgi:hypothetical protein